MKRIQWRGRELVTNGTTFVRLEDQCWPLPQPELAHWFRYSAAITEVSDAQAISAATVMDAYAALMLLPFRRREFVVAAIRRAMEEAP